VPARRIGGHIRVALLLLAPAGLVIAVFAGGLAVTAVASLTDSTGNWGIYQYRKFFSDPFYLKYLWRSLRLAAYCTPITLILGYPIAYVMALASRPVRLALTLVLVVQFFTSYVVRTYALVLVLGNQGIINRWLVGMGLIERPLPLLFHEAGVAIALILVPLPFMIFPIYSVLKNINPNLLTAAASLGASRLKTFWLIVVPLSLPGVLAGVVLVFLFDLTAYVMPGMLGGGYFDMVANFIQQQAMAALDTPFASAISITLLLITIAILYAINIAGARVSGVR
jgi:ABC-type spermidine/putrescine transport system permease subunit I